MTEWDRRASCSVCDLRSWKSDPPPGMRGWKPFFLASQSCCTAGDDAAQSHAQGKEHHTDLEKIEYHANGSCSVTKHVTAQCQAFVWDMIEWILICSHEFDNML